MRAMLKYPRIAVTALSLTACVLLVALWVRSYWWLDFAAYPIQVPRMLMLESNRGIIILSARDVKPGPPGSPDTSARIEYYRHQVGAPEADAASWSYSHDKFGFDATFPHSLPVIISAMIAAVPWIHWSRRFRLRTLLIATTLVAVEVGVIVLSS
jgi:hypothetical protein